MDNLKFIPGEWYRNTRFRDLVLRVIEPLTPHTYRVELYTIAYDRKNPKTLGLFTTYFMKGDKEWEVYDEVQ